LVVQAYCARAGAATDNARKPALSASKYRSPFAAGFPADILVDIVSSLCGQAFAEPTC